MAKVKVRVLNAVVDGKGAGSELSVNETTAKALVANGYVELVAEAKQKEVAEESALEATKTPSRKAPQNKVDKK